MLDEIVTDPDADAHEDPRVDRVPTKPLPPTPRAERTTQQTPLINGGRIEVDLDDPEAVAEFLEMVARVVREKRRLVMVIE